MWPDRRLCDLLEVAHPIIQAPMLGACTPDLAAAVANAGGLGSLGCALKPVDEIEERANAVRARTNGAFNLNFFVHPAPNTSPEALDAVIERLKPWYDKLGLGTPSRNLPKIGAVFGAAELDLLLRLKPKVASFHFGHPGAEAVAALKSAGIVVISTATSVAEARALEAAGMDAIIAQGWEAGGHRGSHVKTGPQQGVGTLALVPQVVDAVSIPVIAAGGIGDGRGIAAAMALGASGVQMGTAFLRCPEAATDAPRRALLAKAQDTDTLVSDAVSGRAARAHRSRFTEEMEDHRTPRADFLHMYALSNPIRNAATEDEASFHLYGQAAALAEDLSSGDLVRKLVEDTAAVFARLG